MFLSSLRKELESCQIRNYGSVCLSTDTLLTVSALLTLCMYRWPQLRHCVLADSDRGVQIKPNIQTFHLLPSFPMLTLCTFPWTGWHFPVFPTPKAVADLWSKFRWCSRTTNCAEACWLKTLLKMCSCCQMWLMHSSEKLHAAGGHFLLIFGCTIWNPSASACCPSARGWWLTIPTTVLVEGARQCVPHPAPGELPGLAPNHRAFHKFGWVCLKLSEGFSCGSFGCQNWGNVAPCRKH